MPDTLSERLEEGIYQIVLFLPQLAAALGILLAGYAIAKMVERGTDVALHRIGFDRWMREGGVSEALERAGTRLDPSTVLAKLVFWIVMLLVIPIAANAIGLAVVSALFAELLAYIPNVIAAVIILVLGLVLGEFIRELVLASAGALPGVPTLARAAKGMVIVLAILMALDQLNIAEDIVLVAFIAVVGAAALAAAIAFGLGGRDVAAEIVRAWYERGRRASSETGPAAEGPAPPPSAGRPESTRGPDRGPGPGSRSSPRSGSSPGPSSGGGAGPVSGPGSDSGPRSGSGDRGPNGDRNRDGSGDAR